MLIAKHIIHRVLLLVMDALLIHHAVIWPIKHLVNQEPPALGLINVNQPLPLVQLLTIHHNPNV